LGPRERREREREEIRGKILDAAREMFVSEGYEAVTMRRIADRIEYSPTAIYFHFKDKEALLRELCETDFLRLAGQFQKIARMADPIERLRAAGRAYVRFAVENPNHYRLMFMTPHPPVDPEETAIEHGNPEQDAYAFLKAIVTDCVSKKRFRRGLTDVELLSQTIWAGVHGVVSLEIAKRCEPWIDWRAFDKRVSAMIDLIVDGLGRAE
jgi:AcrR family transcriptional regulator